MLSPTPAPDSNDAGLAQRSCRNKAALGRAADGSVTGPIRLCGVVLASGVGITGQRASSSGGCVTRRARRLRRRDVRVQTRSRRRCCVRRRVGRRRWARPERRQRPRRRPRPRAGGPAYVGIRGVGTPEVVEVGGFRLHGEVAPSGPLVLLYSSELDSSVQAVRDAGGEVVIEPYDFPGGRRFHFRDPSGNELGVWSAH